MTLFGGLKDRLTVLYGRHSVPVDLTVRFLFALGLFFFIRTALPFHPLLSGVLFLIPAAAVCAVLPVRWISLAGCMRFVGEAFSLDPVAGAVVLAVCLVLILLFMRFAPEESPAAALTCMASYYGFGGLVPICCGLRRGPASLLGVCPGAVFFSAVSFLEKESGAVRAMDPGDYAGKLHFIIGGIFDDRLVILLLSMAACLTLTFAVRSLSADYAHQLAIVCGAAVYLLFLLLGSAVTGAPIQIAAEVVQTAASAVAAFVLLLVFLPLSYRKSEYLRFEDDEYYYYVKAVPKAHGKHYVGESGSFSEVGSVSSDAAITRPDIDDDELARKIEDSLFDLDTHLNRDL